MPIENNLEIRPISEDDFHLLDYKVMELVFSIHNDMGRFWDEKIYQNELASRCQNIGLGEVATGIPIQVSYKDFQKYYYIDLLIDNAVIYEMKTVKALTGEHQKQTLNYLFLMSMQHGKLVNLRPHSVEYSFVSTKLTPEKRYNFTIDDQDWKELNGDCGWLKELIINLLNEWGAFLETNLFYNAIYHFRAGQEHVVEEIEVVNGRHFLGNQKVHLLNPKIAFKISAVTKAVSYYEQHLSRFIRYTSLNAIQWINFNHDKIVFKTILR